MCFILSILSFPPTQLTPSISLFSPFLTPLIISPKKLPILPVTDLITSPILFMTPVTLFFIPVTSLTVPLLILFHFLDMKPPIELILLVVPFLSEPQSPLTPDQSPLALFTVPDLRLFYGFLTPDYKALALPITAFLMLVQILLTVPHT